MRLCIATDILHSMVLDQKWPELAVNSLIFDAIGTAASGRMQASLARLATSALAEEQAFIGWVLQLCRS